MKKLNVVVKAMTPAAIKRTEWREGKPGVLLGYRRVRYAGAIRLVPAVDEFGQQWKKPPTNAEGGQPGNKNAAHGEEAFDSVLRIRCPRELKSRCKQAAFPRPISDWARDVLDQAATK